MSTSRRLVASLLIMAVVSACGADDDSGSPAEAGAPTTVTAEPDPTIATTTTATPTTTTAPTTSTLPTTTTTVPPTTAAPSTDPSCRPLDDPAEGEPTGWTVVNDGVMGGRSLGVATLVEDALVFEGEIVTDGGGFSSIRTPVPDGALTGSERIVVRARTDGRRYLLTADDAAPGRDRRTSFQAPIPFGTDPGVVEAEVRIDDLRPVVFGEPVDDVPFERDLAVEVGVQLSDGLDGPFRLELAALVVCG